MRSYEPVNTTTVGRRAADLLRVGHDNARLLVDNFLEDGTVLVWDTKENGRGSPNYIDNARRLETAHIQLIDNFVDLTHSGGGTVNVTQISDELEKKFPDLLVSHGAIMYALKHYCNGADGYEWGDVKNRKIESDPARLHVKRTYLVDYAAALKKEKEGTHKCAYMDGDWLPPLLCYSSRALI